MTELILEGLVLGLSAGFYCVGACFVFFVPYLFIEGNPNVLENVKKVLSFLLGRFIAYVSFALIVGYVGSSHKNIFTAGFAHICLIAASLLMLAYSLSHNFRDSGFCAPIVR